MGVSKNIFQGSLNIMEWLERWGYVTAGISFLVLGMVVFVYGWYVFFTTVADGVITASLVMMGDLLLVAVLLELFRTLLNFLRTHEITIEPFMHIAIVAAIRHILTTGAKGAIREFSPEQFNHYAMDMGIHILLVLGFVFGLFLFRYRREIAPKN